MRSAFFLRFISSLLLNVILYNAVSAQQPVAITAPPSQSDTVRVIQIIQGKSLRQRTIDTTTLETIAGDVIMQEAQTTISCDSAQINRTTNIVEAFGNIHINQNDSIHTYSQYMRYVGADRIAYLNRKVKLTDNKGGTLFTEDLTYDLKTNIGTYEHGGKVVTGKTVLTSENGVYYADTKDVYFKNNVVLTDPKYSIKTDSLLYNTQTQVATFITATRIKSKNGGDVYTTEGNYDLKDGKAYFGKRTIIKDSTRTYVGDNIAIDDKSGIAQLEGNAIIKDSVNGYTVLGGQVFVNRKNESFLATRKPVLIFKGEGNDSTFISADTLYSGIIKKEIARKEALAKKDSAELIAVDKNDSTKNVGVLTEDTIQNLSLNRSDSTIKLPLVVKNTVQQTKSVEERDTLKQTIVINNASDTAIRYFQAFHHVRIFNDSLQAVCDSLHYSSVDSTFKLFNDPLVFSNNSQIAGDTIYLFTKNKKAQRFYVFENGIIINKASDKIYNQMAGRTINGYFKDGVIDYVRVKGSPAESIFYPQDKDSAYIGMNRSKGDVIDIYFVKKEINKVKFVNDVDGTLYPLRQIPEDQKQLRRFNWQDSRRPKNKFELFE